VTIGPWGVLFTPDRAAVWRSAAVRVKSNIGIGY